MKRIVSLLFALVLSSALFAQGEQFESFASKFEKQKGYEVTSVGRVTIRAASLAADSATRSIYRKIESFVGIVCKNPSDGRLGREVRTLVKGYKKVLDHSQKEGSAQAYINSAATGLVFVITTPQEQTVILLEGEGLDYKEFLPEELKK